MSVTCSTRNVRLLAGEPNTSMRWPSRNPSSSQLPPLRLISSGPSSVGWKRIVARTDTLLSVALAPTSRLRVGDDTATTTPSAPASGANASSSASTRVSPSAETAPTR